MKQLFNNGKVALVQEGDTYTIGKPVTVQDKDGQDKQVLQNQKYYYQPASAVKALAKRVSNDEAEELFEWLAIYMETVGQLEKVFKESK